MAHLLFFLSYGAAFLSISRQRAVFPIDGLAAMTIRSESCSPPVILSSFSKPVLSPEYAEPDAILSFTVIRAFSSASDMGRSFPVDI